MTISESCSRTWARDGQTALLRGGNPTSFVREEHIVTINEYDIGSSSGT
jgi:hypothetical protein